MGMIIESLVFLEAVLRGATTWALLLAILVSSALVGLALYTVQRHLASRSLRWLLSIGTATLALVVAGVLMIIRGFGVPAADSPIFDERVSYLLEIRNPGDELPTFLASIDISIPSVVRINEDAALDVSVGPTSSLFSRDFEVSLRLGKELQARSSQPCAPKKSVPSEAGQVLCATGVPVGTTGAARWVVRAEKPGVSYVTFQLPHELAVLMPQTSMAWSASISRNGEALTKYVVGPNERPWSPGQDRTGLRRIPVKLTAGAPMFRGEGLELNLHALEATFPLRVATTLGVSASTYDMLTITGALASAFLGGGWLWQVLSWVKQKDSSGRDPPKENGLIG